MHAQPSGDDLPLPNEQRRGPGRRDRGWPGNTALPAAPDAAARDAAARRAARDAAARRAALDAAQDALLTAELAAVDARRELPAEDEGAWECPDPDSEPPEDPACVP